MHVHCLSVSNLNSCLCLRHRHSAIEYQLVLFKCKYASFFFFPPFFKLVLPNYVFWKIQDLRFSPGKGSLMFYFFLQYFVGLSTDCSLTFYSFPNFPAVTSSPLFFVSNSKAGITSCLQKRQTPPQYECIWMEGN